jgi:hypothetical protein
LDVFFCYWEKLVNGTTKKKTLLNFSSLFFLLFFFFFSYHDYSLACICALNGNLECLKILQKYKVNLDKCGTAKGETPIFLACFGGFLNIVKFLIKQKVNVNIKNNEVN